MKTRLLFLVFLTLLATLPARAQTAASSLTGLWLTQDHGGVIAVTQCGDGLCARIAGVVLDHPNDRMPVDYQGASQCGLPLIQGAKQVRPNLWRGQIRDPRNGRLFGVELHPASNGRLALRGFFGVPLLGQTNLWTRFTGYVPPDCRMVVPGNTEVRVQGNPRHSG